MDFKEEKNERRNCPKLTLDEPWECNEPWECIHDTFEYIHEEIIA